MKRIGAIVSLLVMLMILSTSMSFASGLTLISSFPEDGESGLMPANIAIKLVFSENMTSEAAQTANENRFAITDAEGKAIKFDPLYNAEKYPNEIWIQITETLTDDTEYNVEISADLESSAGNTLDEPVSISFSTRDTAADSNGYMILMVLMVIGMVVFTAWDTRRQLKKQGAAKEDDKINPYKEAKKTGKSVEEIIAKAEKEKEKATKKTKKDDKGNDIPDTDSQDAVREGVHKVKARKAISAVGVSTPQTVLRRIQRREEAKKAEEVKREEIRSRSKGSKQQQRKKK
ncbi:MAG: hypothetical protein CVU86_06455 [Firmicutes bacterium HGW-Firmicutes-11]|nr:MAG: hypothetical protein CVU86_06455 [Firmicutes bacterium HGW-Firmicutes-11]